jgi:protein phosphatase
MTLRHALVSNTGSVREINEDTARVIELQVSDGMSRQNLLLAVIADGMGGHAAGEVASQTAVSCFANTLMSRLGSLSHVSETDVVATFAAGFETANAAVYQLGRQDAEKQEMGTTLTALLFFNEHVCIGHVGDSRVYRIREGTITQLTRDHTLVQDKVDAGLLTREEAECSEERNVLRKAVGTQSLVQPDIAVEAIGSDDIFLLCTDGLYNSFTDRELLVATGQNADPASVNAALIDEAIARDGSDNLSLIYVRSLAAGFPRRHKTSFGGRSSSLRMRQGIPSRVLLSTMLALVIVMMIGVAGNIMRQWRSASSPPPNGGQNRTQRTAQPRAGETLIDLTLSLESDAIEVSSRGSLAYTVSIAGKAPAPHGDTKGSMRLTVPARFRPAPVQRVGFMLSAASSPSAQWKLTRVPAIFPAKTGVWIDRHLARVSTTHELPPSATQGARGGKVSIGKVEQSARQYMFYLDAKIPIPVIVELATTVNAGIPSPGPDHIANISVRQKTAADRKPEEPPRAARQPAQVAVPDVRGMTLTSATKMIKGVGLIIATDNVYDNDIAQGSILGTEPSPGVKIGMGSAVILRVSQGPKPLDPTVVIPDVNGLTAEEAAKKLTEVGLRAGYTEEADHPSVPKGQVIRVQPKAGEAVARGTTVRLIISQGPELPPAPVKYKCDTCEKTYETEDNLKTHKVLEHPVSHPGE